MLKLVTHFFKYHVSVVELLLKHGIFTRLKRYVLKTLTSIFLIQILSSVILVTCGNVYILFFFFIHTNDITSDNKIGKTIYYSYDSAIFEKCYINGTLRHQSAQKTPSYNSHDT